MTPAVGSVLVPLAPPRAATPVPGADFLRALLSLLANAPVTQPVTGPPGPADQPGEAGGDDPASGAGPRRGRRELDVAAIVLALVPGGAAAAPQPSEIPVAATRSADPGVADARPVEAQPLGVAPVSADLVSRVSPSPERLPVLPPTGTDGEARRAPQREDHETAPLALPLPLPVDAREPVPLDRIASPRATSAAALAESAAPSPSVLLAHAPSRAVPDLPTENHASAPATVTPPTLAPTATIQSAAPGEPRPAAAPTRDHDAVGEEQEPRVADRTRPQTHVEGVVHAAPHGSDREIFPDWERNQRGDGRERGDATRVPERESHVTVAPPPPLAPHAAPSDVGEPGGPPEGVRAPHAQDLSVVDQMVTSVRLIRRDGRHELSLRLEPPDLGAVRIEATLDGRHLTLDIRADQEPARLILERSLPQLRESLAQHGLSADRLTVQLGLDSSGRGSTNGGDGSWRMPAPPENAARAAAPVSVLLSRHDAGHEGVDLWV